MSSAANLVTVVVGSESSLKVQAIREAFREVFPMQAVDVRTVKAGSEINEQPVGMNETLLGGMLIYSLRLVMFV
jgi:non-canonical (house-cleaning) NTP pyrophosphatase